MQNSMYYTTSGLTSLPAYQGGGYLDQYGRQQYGLGKLVKKITKPIASVLDKVIPNEIKPALPYIAAVAPFFGGFGLTGLLPEFSSLGSVYGPIAQKALSGSITNAISQLSQEGSEKRGLNLPSNLFAAATSALSGTDTAKDLLGEKTLGMIGEKPYTASQVLALPEGSSVLNDIQVGNLPLTEQIKNTALNVGSTLSSPLGKATKAVNEGDILSMDFARGAATPIIGAATEQTYNLAQDALDKYNLEQNALGQMGVADQSKRRAAIAHAMQLSEPGISEDRLNDIYQRLGLADGGVGYQYGGGAVGYREGGLMSLGGHEMDFRAAGGFVPIGKKERADDVPARLSKNEFVFTAKAVRNAGGGDIKQGAKKMYQIMKQLEARA